MEHEIRHERDLMTLWLDTVPDLTYREKRILLEITGGLSECFYASEEALRKAGAGHVPEPRILALIKNRNRDFLEEGLGRLLERRIGLLYPGCEAYPEKLAGIFDPPLLLYVRGNPAILSEKDRFTVGVVGSRRPDTYGREVAAYFSAELAKQGICVVSGLAKGVDGIAHKAALAAGGKTVGVLGCGINVTYPAEHLPLFDRMEAEGVLLSEYGPDVPALSWHFPARNRIISGLSNGVLCVQAKKKSGSLITTDFALEQGRQVYAVPARAFDLNYEGTNNLIKNGALCVTSPEDILEDLAGPGGFSEKKLPGALEKRVLLPEPTEEEKKVLACLNLDPCYIDDIIEKSGFGITKTISLLYMLEQKGAVKQPRRGYYIVADFSAGVTYR